MNILEPFNSARLKYRPVEERDAPALYDIYRCPEVMAGMPSLPVSTSLEQGYKKVERLKSCYINTGLGLCAVEVEEAESPIIGLAGLSKPLGTLKDQYPQSLEIGYVLHPLFWRRGLATEMVMAWTERTWQMTHVEQVVAAIAPDNIASQRVVRKCGYIFGSAQRYLMAYTRFYVCNRPCEL